MDHDETRKSEETFEFTEEEGRRLYEFFELLNQINERCKAEGNPVIPEDDEDGA